MIDDAAFREKCKKAYLEGVRACEASSGNPARAPNPYYSASLREQWNRGWNSVVGNYAKKEGP